jgi:hypothetical protein
MKIIIYNPKSIDYDDILNVAKLENALLVKCSTIETVEIKET